MAGQEEHFGDSQSHQTCWAPPDPAEEGQLMRKVKDPPVLHPTHWPNFAHTKQEKSVFAGQLSLSTTKWAKAFKRSKKKRKICENAAKETPPKTNDSKLKTKQNPQINAIKAESNYNASKGEGS